MDNGDKSSTPASRNDQIYGSDDLSDSLPDHGFPGCERDPRNVYAEIRDELMLDGNARQNLATFCQTWEEPEVHQLMDDCIDKNMVDKDEYPQTAEIEQRCVSMLADLWNAPSDGGSTGCSTTGSSEAAMLGGLAMKRRWEARRKAEGKPIDKPNLITGPVQVCWHKFTLLIAVQRGGDGLHRLVLASECHSQRWHNADGILVAAAEHLFGGHQQPTFFHRDFPVLDVPKKNTGIDIPIHVDGASGGFLAPFCAPDLVWDFRLSRVKSINASGHKFGLAPLGVGWIMWRSASDLPEELVFWVNYLGGNMRDIALNFSRPGGQIACQYYNFLRLGREGYTKIHTACYATARELADEIAALGPFDVLYDGDMASGIPALCWTLKPGSDPGFTLFDLADRLRVHGWQVPAYTLPANCQSQAIQRILVRNGVSRDLATLLMRDIRSALEHLGKHPAQTPLDASTATGFHH